MDNVKTMDGNVQGSGVPNLAAAVGDVMLLNVRHE